MKIMEFAELLTARRFVGFLRLAVRSIMVVCTLAALTPNEFANAQNYNVIEISPLPLGAYSKAFGINGTGQVIGTSDYLYLGSHVDHAIFNRKYSLGRVSDDLSVLPNYLYSYGTAINGNGDTAGYCQDIIGHTHAVAWIGANRVDLGTLGGPDSWAYGMNDSRKVVGVAYFRFTAIGSGPTGFLWHDDNANGLSDPGEMTSISATLGGSTCRPYAINNLDQIVGEAQTAGNQAMQAFLWDSVHGTTIIGTFGGGNSAAYAINSAGQMVGVAQLANGNGDAFLWTPTFANGQIGSKVDLGVLPPNLLNSVAYGINNLGQIVGAARLWYGISTFNDRAVIFANGKAVDLNTRVSPNIGWILNEARGINDSGWIVGWGTHNGKVRGFLLTPQ